MTSEQWRRAEELCEAVLKLPSEERSAFLLQSCGNDATLRQHVEALLEGHDRTDFLAQPAMEVAARAMATRQEGFLVGQQIAHYRILSILGAGGMGEVYRAHDDRLQRDVAIKVLSETPVNDVYARSRLLREARSAAALNHSNVCTIYEVGEAGGLGYIAMELIEGQPLSQLIPAGGLSNAEVLRYALQIADATGHAHEKGVIHRDLKTSNILVARQRQVKVLDFGLAKRLNKDQLSQAPTVQSQTLSTQTGMLVGTLPYMAPEQFRGQPADARSDVWALGVILYELAAGVRPFQGQTTFDLSASILTQAPPPLPARVPAALEAVIQRCLQKEPGDRYSDGGEVRTALEAIPVTSTTIVPTDAAPRKRPWLYVPIGVAALIVFGFALTWMRSSTNTETTPTTPRNFTRYVGWEVTPSWSPDRSRIAYTHIVGSSADIAVLSPAGDPQVLTKDSPADEFNPSFSPTGSRIAYVSDRGAGTNVYSIPASGGPERQEAETHIPFLQRMGAWASSLGSNPWSPDEKHLVFSRLEPSGDVALWIVNLDTRKEDRLTSPPSGAEDGSATWSPDSRTIAFTRTHNGLIKLWMIPASGGPESIVLEDGIVDMMPAWTSDSSRLIFSSARSGAVNLWETRPGARTPPRQLTFGPGADFTPAVARDGSIAYGQFDHEIDIYRVNLESRNLEDDPGVKLTTFTGENFGPRISQDGTVLYYSNRADNNYDVWLIDKTGTHRNLTHHPSADRLADWSPDGKEIVFMSDREGAVRLWVLETETEKVRLLTSREQKLSQASHTAEAEGGPRWSPDGKLIAYAAPTGDGSAIWVVAPDGSNPHATTIRGATSFAWYKDSQRLIYTRQSSGGSGQQQLVATNLATGVEQVLRTGAIAEIAVSADGSRLSFMNSVSHFTMDLFALSLGAAGENGLPSAGREARQITFGKGLWHAHAGGFAPDGKSLVYSRDRDFGDIHVIEKNPQD